MSWKFFKATLQDLRVGAITETSKYTIGKILSFIKPTYKYIVEYGAGCGTVTREILKRLPADGKVIAIEINNDFYKELLKIKDSRLIVIKGDIMSLLTKLTDLGLPEIHMVISNIPFTFLDLDSKNKIIESTFKALNNNGRFVVFQYSTLVKRIMETYFGKISLLVEFRNFPPYFIMAGEKLA